MRQQKTQVEVVKVKKKCNAKKKTTKKASKKTAKKAVKRPMKVKAEPQAPETRAQEQETQTTEDNPILST